MRERAREGERAGEKHQRVVPSHASPTGDLATTQACALVGIELETPWFTDPCSVH